MICNENKGLLMDMDNQVTFKHTKVPSLADDLKQKNFRVIDDDR